MWELVVVFIVGLVVLGPERLPVAIRTVSNGQFRKSGGERGASCA